MWLSTSYGEYSKVEKPVLVTTSYEKSDDKEGLKAVPIISNNNNNNLGTDSNSVIDIKSNNKKAFHEDIDNEVKATPKNHY